MIPNDLRIGYKSNCYLNLKYKFFLYTCLCPLLWFCIPSMLCEAFTDLRNTDCAIG